MLDTRRTQPTLIKQYAGARLYDPAACAYVALTTLQRRFKKGDAITVVDAASGEDVTDSVLTSPSPRRRRF